MKYARLLLLLLPALSLPDSIAYVTGTNGLTSYIWTSTALGALQLNYAYGETLFVNASFSDPTGVGTTVTAFAVNSCTSKVVTTTNVANDTVVWTGCSVSGHTFNGTVVYSVPNYTPSQGAYAGTTIPTMLMSVTVTNTDPSAWNFSTQITAPGVVGGTLDSGNSSSNGSIGVVAAAPIVYQSRTTFSFAAWISSSSGNAAGTYPSGTIGIGVPKNFAKTGTIAAGVTGTAAYSERFLVTDTPAATIYSLAKDAFTAYASQINPSLYWPDRRPIIADFATNFSNSTAADPYGYNGIAFDPGTQVSQPSVCGGANTITASVLQQSFVNHACQNLAALHTIWVNTGMTAQAVIAWDLEGQEFAQPFSYMGDPHAWVPTPFSSIPYNPNLSALIAEWNIYRSAMSQSTSYQIPNLKVGMTLRPQHISYYQAANVPATCTYFADGANGGAVPADATASMTSGSNTVTITDSAFTSALNPTGSGVNTVYKRMIVVGAGTAGANLVSYITAFVDSNHVTINDNAVTTVSAATAYYNFFLDFDQRLIVTDGAFGSRFTRCDTAGLPVTVNASGYITTAAGTWITLATGDGTQTEYFTGDDASVIAELESKVRVARQWGATVFYVDSTVWANSGSLDFAVWQALTNEFPDCVFLPEEEDANTYSFAGPFQDPSVNAIISPVAVAEVNLAGFQFTKLQNYVGTGDVGWTNPTTKGILENAAEIGNIWGTAGVLSDAGAQTNLGSMHKDVIAAESLVNVLDTSTNRTHGYPANPKTSYLYPLVERVYFAASTGTLPASTLYCEAGRNPSQDGIQPNPWRGGNVCNLDLTGVAYYQIRYYDFGGALVSAAPPYPF